MLIFRLFVLNHLFVHHHKRLSPCECVILMWWGSESECEQENQRVRPEDRHIYFSLDSKVISISQQLLIVLPIRSFIDFTIFQFPPALLLLLKCISLLCGHSILWSEINSTHSLPRFIGTVNKQIRTSDDWKHGMKSNVQLPLYPLYPLWQQHAPCQCIK
jgi:hypothetical protein